MSHFSLKERSLDLAVHIAVFAAIFGFLLSYFQPTHLLSNTITAGGDTPSHYAAAEYFIHTLLPEGKIIGWMPGNYAGFPLFQFYFPLPFLIMALLQIFMPLQISFKLVTVLGIFLLPVCSYGCLRLLRQKPPIPLIGAIFTLPFLFMEANSMWGGNIPSTLAGEFAYSMGFALLVLYIGTFYRGIIENRYVHVNALLLTLIGLSHGYTLLFAVFATTFSIFTTKDFLEKFAYYLKVNALAFFLMGFWLIQLLWFIPYTTAFNFVWVLDGIAQVFPMILLPVIALALLGIFFVFIRDVRARELFQAQNTALWYVWFIVLTAGSLFFIGFNINLVDIRFLPYVQFFLLILGAMGTGYLTERIKARFILAPLLACLVILWVNRSISYIPNWIESNYSGFEHKHMWPQFKAINNYLKGSYQDPRVVYEHDLKNQGIGSLRAFESLPLFSGRSTLEGLYIQSSITSPFVFYLQSEISPRPSCPLPNYNYSRMDLEKGLEHLKIFNVSHFVAVTDDVKQALERTQKAVRLKDFPPYTVYRLTENPDKYVSLLAYEPTLIVAKNWRRIAFEWFRRGDLGNHIAFKDKLEPCDRARFKTIIHDNSLEILSRIPFMQKDSILKPVTPMDISIKETIKPEEIIIETPYIGRPHLVKVSYHPNWHVEGADRVYPISPSFMLIYPTQKKVRLYFGPSLPNYIGFALSFVGLLIILAPVKQLRNLTFFDYTLSIIGKFISGVIKTFPLCWLENFLNKKSLVRLISLIVIATAMFIFLAAGHHDATSIYNKGMAYYNKGEYKKAREFFEKGMKSFPLSSIVDQTAFHFAITYFKENNWQKALNAFEEMAENYPESRMFTEVLYHIGICCLRLEKPGKAIEVFQKIIDEFPEDRWARHANERLGEIGL